MESLSQIALTFVPGLGNTSIRRLVDLYPDDDPFALPASELKTIFANHPAILGHIQGKTSFPRAEQELAFCEKNGIRLLFFTSPDYPQRLNRAETEDCPALLYVMGTADLNPDRSVAIVGTRRATPQGRDNTDRLVGQLKAYRTPIVSGLAYGIDTAAHAAALGCGLPTVAVLGHGLNRIYPPENRNLAAQIVQQGGALLTEYPMGTAISARNFPARNRIIAALADATLVVEASERGGALITAAIAAGYHREVFAVPGRLDDTYSRGTNNLIATNKALLVRDADDIAYHMGWPLATGQTAVQTTIFPTLTPDGQRLYDLLRDEGPTTIDELASRTSMSLSAVAGTLFDLEMQRVVRALPGRHYEAVT